MSIDGGMWARGAAVGCVCTALIASVALLGCGSSGGSAAADHPATWAEEAARVCSQAFYDRERLPEIHIATYHEVVPEMIHNERALAARLAALRGADRDASSVKRLTALLMRQALATEAVLDVYGTHTYGPHGRVPEHKADVRRAGALNRPIGALARSLRAGSCARTPVRTANL